MAALISSSRRSPDIATAIAADGSDIFLRSVHAGTELVYDPRLPRDHMLRLLPQSLARRFNLHVQKDPVTLSEPVDCLFLIFNTYTPDFQFCTLNEGNMWSAQSNRDTSGVWRTTFGKFDTVHMFKDVPTDVHTLEVRLYRAKFDVEAKAPELIYNMQNPWFTGE